MTTAENNYELFRRRLRALDTAIHEFALFFNRQHATWHKRGEVPEWAWDVLVSWEEFPGLLEYYRHLMALRKERESRRVKNPQPLWLIGKQRKRASVITEPAPKRRPGRPPRRARTTSVEPAAVAGDQPTVDMPVAGET
jgi:hypothetical protein